MRPLFIYADASVIGGCEDAEFAEASCALWKCFIEGKYRLFLSALTLKELEGAPSAVRSRLNQVPISNVIMIADNDDASDLAEEYLKSGVVGDGSRADANHVALATVARVDFLVSWNFRHIVNVGRIRKFNAVNLRLGYGILDIRTPWEVLDYEKDI